MFFFVFQVIKITNRRVNAIEHVIIPKIERTLAYIISELVINIISELVINIISELVINIISELVINIISDLVINIISELVITLAYIISELVIFHSDQQSLKRLTHPPRNPPFCLTNTNQNAPKMPPNYP